MKYRAHSIPHIYTRDSFQHSVIDSGEAVLVGFLRVEPGYDQKISAMQFASSSTSDGLKVLVLDIDTEEVLLEELALEGTPTFIFFHDGKEKGRILGDADGNRLTRFISKSLQK